MLESTDHSECLRDPCRHPPFRLSLESLLINLGDGPGHAWMSWFCLVQKGSVSISFLLEYERTLEGIKAWNPTPVRNLVGQFPQKFGQTDHCEKTGLSRGGALFGGHDGWLGSFFASHAVCPCVVSQCSGGLRKERFR